MFIMNRKWLTSLVISFLSLLSLELSFARSPAVEEFIGIDVIEGENDTTQNKAPLFNLERDIAETGFSPFANQNQRSSISWEQDDFFSSNMSALILFMLALPVIIWLSFIIYLRIKSEEQRNSQLTSLEDYRKKREEQRQEREDKIDEQSEENPYDKAS